MTTNEETPNESSEQESALEEVQESVAETAADGAAGAGAAADGVRETVADAAAGASAATSGARETVAGAGAEAKAPQTETPLTDGDTPVPRMPDGRAAKAAETALDKTAADTPDGDMSDVAMATDDTPDGETADHDTPDGAMSEAPASASAVDPDGDMGPEPSGSEPTVGRYDLPRNHRIAADTKGRTLSESEFKSLSRRSLLTGVVGAAAAFMGWRTIQNRPIDDRIPDVLRDVHQANESIWRGLFREGAEAPTFDYSESSMMRINGRHGIREELDMASWELVVVGRNGERLGTHGLEDLRSMEQVEMTVEHKCVEGWAHIVTWGGVPFSDFVERYYPEEAAARFVGLATPDNEYRVGLDMDSMLHSQTLLALDLQREPLSDQHGAPVRLTTPLKYGIKQIKRIGTIEFTDTQPEGDYWATRGYDWYAGL